MDTAAGFTIEGKALTAHELRSGDLEVSGYAAVWQGLDAQAENFIRGAFAKAIPTALAAGLPIAWHHDNSRILGHVLEAREDGTGLRIRARIDRQDPGSPLFHLYESIRRGSAKGLSCAGYFQRVAGMIAQVLRLTEVSITGTPVHPLTGLDAVEVKAISERAQLEAAYMVEATRQLALADVRLSVAEFKLSRLGAPGSL